VAKVVNLNEVQKAAKRFTPAEILENVKREMKQEDSVFNYGQKIMVISLDDVNGYNYEWMQCGMSNQDIIALCKVVMDRAEKELISGD